MSHRWLNKPKAGLFTPLFLALLLLAVACGAAAPEPAAPAAPVASAPDTSAPDASAPSAKATPTAMPRVEGGKPKTNRLVVTGVVQGYETTDPFAMSPSSLPAIHPMYEHLVQFDRNTLEFTPMLAKSWDVASDFSTVTFQLQDGVQWHKGYGDFTSDDVVNTYEKMVSESSITTYVAQWKTFLDPADPAANFDVVSPGEITFKWTSPQLDWPLFVSRIVDFTIVSKAHFDAEGMVEGPRDNPIGPAPTSCWSTSWGRVMFTSECPTNTGA